VRSLKKAYEITDAKIQFVSLVDKAANKRKFLLKKEANGRATFTTYGKIVKADVENHYVTGIVYEPLTEDSHGNYMTEAEITKAAYHFAKNGNKVDLQHSFEPLEGASVVESWIAKADFDIGGEQIKKGTWLMTVEVADESVWEGIEKGDITGLSMGGLGNYSEEDVDLDTISKTESKGLFKKLAKALGYEVVEKGEMEDLYEKRSKGSRFWDALNTLENVLRHYNPITDSWEFEEDPGKVAETLEDFNKVITEIVTGGQDASTSLAQTMPVEKAGRKMSGKNFEALKGIFESLGAFIAAFEDPDSKEAKDDESDTGAGTTDSQQTEQKEDKTVTKSEVEQIVEEAVQKAVATATGTVDPEEEKMKEAEAEDPAGSKTVKKAEDITPESISEMVQQAVAKAMEPKEDSVTLDQVREMITKAVHEAVEPVLKSKGVPTALDMGRPSGESQHYLHGIL